MANTHRPDRGFMMVALLIGMGITAIWMTAALPSWRQQVQRTREADLIFRGEQYARAIVLYQVKNRGVLPPSIDVLVSQHFLRKKWKDPVTNDDFQPVGVGIVALPGQGTTPQAGQTASPQAGGSAGRGGQASPGGGAPISTGGQGQPGISGVRSKSTETSIKIYQQQQQYNLWQFDAALMRQKMGIQNAGNQQGGRQGPGAGGDRQGGDAGARGGGGRGGGGRGGGGRGTGAGRGGGAGTDARPPVPIGPGRGRGGMN